METLLRLGADPNLSAGSQKRWTPIMHAAIRDHGEIIKLLLAHGGDLSRKDRLGLTALDYAKERSCRKAISVLTEF